MNYYTNEIAENEKRRKKKYKENVELRRNLVQTLLVKGNTQWEIAESLDISQATVSRDIQWLRSVAKKELKEMLEKKFPEEYQRYLVSFDEVLRHTWEIALCGLTVEKTRLEALQFVIECCKQKMELIVNPPVLKSNNTLKPLKNADNAKGSDNSLTRNQKVIKKDQYE